MDYSVGLDIALPRMQARNIMHVFKFFAQALSKHTGISERFILEALLQQEDKHSSALSGGFALSHIQSSKINSRYVALMSLRSPIHMDTPDDTPVDLFGLLLSPEKDGNVHLRGMSRFSRMMKNEDFCQLLRETKDADAMRALFTNPDGWVIAA